MTGSSQQPFSELQQEARELLERLASAFTTTNKSQIRRSKGTTISRAAKPHGISGSAQRLSILIIAMLVVSSVSVTTIAEERSNTDTGNVSIADEQNGAEGILELSMVQRGTLLTESADLYSRATDVAKTDSAEAQELFTSAAEKYQLLVESGVHNALLYRNLGNACLQSNQLGRAIVNYERARLLDSDDRQLAVNLEFANSLVKTLPSPAENTTVMSAGEMVSLPSLLEKLRTLNHLLIDIAGIRPIIWTVVISSLLFWSLLIVRATGYRFPVKRFAIVLFLPLMTSLASAALASRPPPEFETGIIVENTVTLRTGDGELFDAVLTVDTAQGHRVRILTSRGNWTQVKISSGQIGWVPARDVERFSPPF